ncbi:probable zinc metalloprotease EGY2, chloroplastic isoform X2 [Cryptomeria japonica]|uniref:probable zinc metalloprotease EGY2, chloroplastic isoform X2 n=1 Tax=Cryptomeria japonica TaxID=3369 RepID=UPI0025AD5067|nr:probable zinc metalloprotease EGY2, chloroplastic isoform X2 [Cryptomeria japonica]
MIMATATMSVNLTPNLVASFTSGNRPWNHSFNTNTATIGYNGATVLAWKQRLKFICGTFQRRRPRFECRASVDENDNDQEGRDLDDSSQKASPSVDSDKNTVVNIEMEQDEIDASKVTSGSPLPGVKPPSEPVKIPKATLDILRDQVFGFDTFFVTGQEPYEGGVLFKGNLRGEATNSYAKLTKRLQERFGEQYKLYLLVNPEDDRPIAVVVPKESLQAEPTAVPEWFAASAFGLVTVFTILLRNAPALQLNLSSFGNIGLLEEGLPGALITVAILGAHEIGHILVARKVGADLGVPYFVPSWQIGSFGAITRIKNALSNRKDLLQFAAAGPLAGFSLAFAILLAGFILPPSNGQEVIVDASVFHDSFLVGGIAKLILGDVLKEGTKVAVNPLVTWAWSGLLINALNSIPAGELDGGRISLALWGRKVWSRLTAASIALLGFSALFNDVAFYWVVLIVFLQRGPISPQLEEISQPDNKGFFLGITVLVLGLLICLPFPFPFVSDNML